MLDDARHAEGAVVATGNRMKRYWSVLSVMSIVRGSKVAIGNRMKRYWSRAGR